MSHLECNLAVKFFDIPEHNGNSGYVRTIVMFEIYDMKWFRLFSLTLESSFSA